MSVIVFAGPSLPRRDRLLYPEFTFLPPVRQGELYAAARTRPHAIGVIDGFFDGQPAVWHKEVLWALSEGIAVFGAASMGALRAAELHGFGMSGVGRIFEDFRDGRLEDDDEVALLHGPAEADYVALSEPMVNIRATIESAKAQGLLDAEIAAHTLSVAKALFYQERNWPSILDVAALPPALREKFSGWLTEGRVDQKRQDALALLDALRHRGDEAPAAPFVFEWTEAWASAPWLSAQPQDEVADADAILNELRLNPAAYHRARHEALLMLLTREVAAGSRDGADQAEISRATRDFRLSHGMMRQADVDVWNARNDIDRNRFAGLMKGQAELRGLLRERDAELRGLMLDGLRLRGDYPELRARARAKRQATAADAGPVLPPPALLAWYFHQRLGEPYPEDLAAYALELGFPDLVAFRDFVAAEHAYSTSPSQRAAEGFCPEALANTQD